LRDLFTLSSVLRRAVRTGELTENPVRRVDKPRIDRRGKVRFLDQAEESRLRDALKACDEEMQNLRTAANERRQKRDKDLLPREQSGSGTRLFDVATGFRTAWEKLLKRATITRFR
jgi:hypothetical protein